MTPKLYDRTKAFLIHLSISFVIFIIISYTILAIWYPNVYFHFGGKKALTLIASIDLILGPALTFIVFDKAKKSLKFDLIVIASLQFAALTYGLISVFNGRPILQILSHDGVYIVSRNEVLDYKLDLTGVTNDAQKLPAKFFLDLPKSSKDIKSVEYSTALVDAIPLYLRSDLYRNFPATPTPSYVHPTGSFTHKVNIYSNIKSEVGTINIETGELNLTIPL